MHKGRLEAFSDGVLAIILTIMVLELKVPHDTTLAALRPVFPVFLSFVLSFIYIGIYWNNHHHMLQLVQRVNGSVLWANLHLLFWLSLIPFVTAWMGEHSFEPGPIAMYGLVLLLSGLAFAWLTRCLAKVHDKDSPFAAALGRDTKGKRSVALYALGVALSFWAPSLALAIYAGVALMWLVPDRRVEKVLGENPR
jgi:uncharacterized membrane protein